LASQAIEPLDEPLRKAIISCENAYSDETTLKYQDKLIGFVFLAGVSGVGGYFLEEI
jgi:hypothetical protein